MRRTLPLMLCLSLALVGCKAKELVDKAAISKDLDKRGTTDLMKEVADDEYTAPADGQAVIESIELLRDNRVDERLDDVAGTA